MDQTQLRYYKNLILAKREKLLHSLDLLKERGLNSTPKESNGELSAFSYHMADQGTDNMEREKAFLFASREGNLLYHLDLALNRIDKGEYGRCINCKKSIGYERLEAVPHARLCIECKSREERSKF